MPQKSSLAANWIPQKTAVRFAVLRCSSLFLILIEIAWYFADFRTPSSSLARPQDMGPAGSPVFAENLQALTIPFAITTTPLSILSYCYSSFPRATSIHITTKMRNCQLENGSKVKIRALGGFCRERGCCGICRYLAGSSRRLTGIQYLTDGIGRARLRRKWQVSSPRPKAQSEFALHSSQALHTMSACNAAWIRNLDDDAYHPQR